VRLHLPALIVSKLWWKTTKKSINQNIQIYEKNYEESFSAWQRDKKVINHDETNSLFSPYRFYAGFGNGVFPGHKI
jgi:hypothetical protein